MRNNALGIVVVLLLLLLLSGCAAWGGRRLLAKQRPSPTLCPANHYNGCPEKGDGRGALMLKSNP